MSWLIDKVWYGNNWLMKWLLAPCSFIYRWVVSFRRWYITAFFQKTYPVPIIVVGNISVGGVGKTPLVIALAENIQQKGFSVGIVSRGYGACLKTFPHEVRLNDSALQVGDEPLLLAKKTNCPVVIAPKRVEAIDYLLAHHHCDFILSDDGLQHYPMNRVIEIAVVDGMRQLGNQLCLPAGPLREPPTRLSEVDFVVVNEGVFNNAYGMRLIPGKLTYLKTNQAAEPHVFNNTNAAVAGIGNPQRFYSTLTQLGLKFTQHTYPDHHHFSEQDFKNVQGMVIMTEKDAVKCQSFSTEKMVYLPVQAVVEERFWQAFWSHKSLCNYNELASS